MTAVSKYHSVNHLIFNATLTLFGMSLLWQLSINQDNITCHVFVMTTSIKPNYANYTSTCHNDDMVMRVIYQHHVSLMHTPSKERVTEAF